jgi:hypothetical protein
MRNRLATAAALSTALFGAGALLGAPVADAGDAVAAVPAAHAVPAAPAAGARPAADTTHFDVTLGNTYTRGTLTWSNRSFHLVGEHKSVSATSCRGTTAFAVKADDHDAASASSKNNVCGKSDAFDFWLTVDVAGIDVVRVCLDNGATTPPLTYLKCVRYSRP